MRVFVAGATGVIGHYLVPGLIAAGHEVTGSTRSAALTSLRNFRRFDAEFAVTNELRTRGTDYLLAAGRQAGTRRFIVQSFTGWNNARTPGPVASEDEPLDPHPLPGTSQTMAAIKHVEQTVPRSVPEGIVLRYGKLLGGELAVSLMTQTRGASNAAARRELGWAPRYSSWRDGFPVWISGRPEEHANAA